MNKWVNSALVSSLIFAAVSAAEGQTVQGDVTASNVNGIRFAGQFPSLQAAIDETCAAGGGTVLAAPKVYYENIRIPCSSLSVIGYAQGASKIMAPTNAPAILLDSSQRPLKWVTIKNFTLLNNSSDGDGILLTGAHENDFHNFEHLTITSEGGVGTGFGHCLHIGGRSIWNRFVDLKCYYSRGHGIYGDSVINMASGLNVNHTLFETVFSNYNDGDGFHFEFTGDDAAQNLVFFDIDAEQNGQDKRRPNCAGFSSSGVSASAVLSSWFEANCLEMTDGMGAGIRLTGIYSQSFTLRDNNILNSSYGIYNNAILSSGEYSGNRVIANVESLHAETTDRSKIVVGLNDLYPANTNYVVDVNGNNHITQLFPLAFAQVMRSVSDGILDASDANAISITNSSTATLNRITGGTAGQILLLGPVVAPLIITNSYGGNGSIYVSTGTNIQLARYEWALLLKQQETWLLISRAGAVADPFVASPEGKDVRHFSVQSCTTPALVNGACTMTVALPGAPYPDTNYRVFCSVYNTNELAWVGNTSVKTATSFNINLVAGTPIATSGTFECVAMHD